MHFYQLINFNNLAPRHLISFNVDLPRLHQSRFDFVDYKIIYASRDFWIARINEVRKKINSTLENLEGGFVKKILEALQSGNFTYKN